jgi:hypothetical protein
MTTVPPLAAKVDLTIEQGAHFALRILWKDAAGDPVDVTGYTARWPMRTKRDDTLMIELTTENNQIVLGLVGSGDTAYNIAVDLDEDDTAALAAVAGRHNLELIPANGETRRLARGDVVVSAEVQGAP